jgi:ubiquinone/menaquinone biosynthesis C-methylase UbiE
MLKRDMDVRGNDLSPKMIKQARGKLTDADLYPARVLIADVTRLPFREREFNPWG